VADSRIAPSLAFAAPNHPSYPSSHSCASSAMGAVLSARILAAAPQRSRWPARSRTDYYPSTRSTSPAQSRLSGQPVTRVIAGESGLSIVAHAYYRDLEGEVDSLLVVSGVKTRNRRDDELSNG